MEVQKFEQFNIESENKAEMSRKIDKMIREGKSSLDIINLVTNEVMADVRNKLGPVATLISLVEVQDDPQTKDYIAERIPELIRQSYVAIDYIKDYNFDNKYKDIFKK